MKYVIEIPKPCSEKWEQMDASERGRYCHSCKKEVVDFSRFSNAELAKYIHNNNNKCGRFLVSQLNQEIVLPKTKTRFPLRIFLGFSSIISSIPTLAQDDKSKIEKIQDIKALNKDNEKDYVEITGTVSDESGLLSGANIIEKKTRKGTQTDVNGSFTIQIPKKNFNKPVYLSFTFIGLEDEIIEVFQNTTNLKVELKSRPEAIEGMVMTGGYCVKKKSIFTRIRNLFRRKNTCH